VTLPEYKKILVPTDGSEFSFYAGEHAVYLAKSMGSKVYILNIINTELAFHAGIHYAEGLSELEIAGKEATGRIKNICIENGVECEELIIKGPPADTIIHVADEMKADIIVIGSIGMSKIERVLIGSVSEKVMRHAKCPVLMVRKH
jgi:nucleotide-binding universal stress UspA family protein